MPQYTVAKFAELMGVSRWTVYNWVRAKKLPDCYEDSIFLDRVIITKVC